MGYRSKVAAGSDRGEEPRRELDEPELVEDGPLRAPGGGKSFGGSEPEHGRGIASGREGGISRGCTCGEALGGEGLPRRVAEIP